MAWVLAYVILLVNSIWWIVTAVRARRFNATMHCRVMQMDLDVSRLQREIEIVLNSFGATPSPDPTMDELLAAQSSLQGIEQDICRLISDWTP